jgi:hypothetical protein
MVVSRALDRLGQAIRIANGEDEVAVVEGYKPFDETVAMLRLEGELDELDYDDLVLTAED